MNLGSLLVLLKLVGDTGFTVSPKTESRPPTSDRPIRPDCGAGKQAIWNEAFEKWDCVVEFD